MGKYLFECSFYQEVKERKQWIQQWLLTCLHFIQRTLYFYSKQKEAGTLLLQPPGEPADCSFQSAVRSTGSSCSSKAGTTASWISRSHCWALAARLLNIQECVSFPLVCHRELQRVSRSPSCRPWCRNYTGKIPNSQQDKKQQENLQQQLFSSSGSCHCRS